MMRDFLDRDELMRRVGSYVSEKDYKGICEDFDACSQTVEEFLRDYPFALNETTEQR